MSEELEIQVLAKSERFNEKKEALKAFSEEIPEQSDLPTVPQEENIFNIFSVDYGVKGKDLNTLTDAVQNRMIEKTSILKILFKNLIQFTKLFSY